MRLGPRHVVDDALNDGVLRRLFPSVYVLAGAHVDRRLMRRAALAYLPAAALSHVDALDVWGLAGAGTPAIHLTVLGTHRAIADPALVVHRRTGFRAGPPVVTERGGLRVVRLEQALVESWPLLPELDRRSPIIAALRERRTTAARLTAALGENPRRRGAAQMRRLVGLVAGGCHSELEVWGHDRVFSDPRLPPSFCQHVVYTAGRTTYLDRYFPVERVDVELDGAAWHGQREQRERDLRRDAALSAMGIMVVRYSHRRLMTEPESVVDELRVILAGRRAATVAV